MAETNGITAALQSAEDFMRLRRDLMDVMKDGLVYSFDDADIRGFEATAESIIVMLAERLSPASEGGK